MISSPFQLKSVMNVTPNDNQTKMKKFSILFTPTLRRHGDNGTSATQPAPFRVRRSENKSDNKYVFAD
jgi:hypothetical protein